MTTLAPWLALASRLDQSPRRSASLYARMRLHWRALTVPMIRAATQDEIEVLIAFINRPSTGAFRKPRGGMRRRTH